MPISWWILSFEYAYFPWSLYASTEITETPFSVLERELEQQG